MRAVGVALRLLVVPLVALALITWWLVGDLSEPGGEDDLFRLPLAEREATALGLVGLTVAAGAVLDWVITWRRREPRVPAAWLTIVGVTAGFLAGAGLRVLTARVGGANIGGGMVLLATPVAALALLVITVWLSLTIARRITSAT